MNVVLIGMPGVGKSTVGVVLAKSMGYDFIDTDILITQREGTLLQTLINTKGMSAFLDLEEEAILSITGDQRIIATGGSVVYREKAMAHLKTLGRVIYLKQHFKVIERRVRNIKTRGIAMGANQSLIDVYWERKVLYEQYADVIIPCRRKSVEGLVQIIMTALKDENDTDLP